MGIGATIGRHDGPAVDALQAAYLGEAARLAYLLTGHQAAADRIARTAFVRAYGTFRGAKDPWDFELAVRRAVCELARRDSVRRRVRAILRRGQDPAGQPPDRLWGALQALPLRRRTAIVVLLGEGLSVAEAADAMSCPTSTVTHLFEKGLRDLADDAPGGELQGALRRLLQDRAGPVSAIPARSVSSRARLRRILIGALWAVLIAAGFYALASASSVSPQPEVNRDAGTTRSYEQNRGYSLLRIRGEPPPADERLAIAQGRIGLDKWALSAYRDGRNFLCMDVSLNVSYRTLDCVAPALSGFHAFVASSMPRDATFVYGDVASGVASLDFRLQPSGRHELHLFGAPSHLELRPGTSMYAAVIPKYMVRLESRAEARALDYRPLDGVLIARDEQGRVLQRTFIFMGRPKG